jgi:hypothetical protein
MTQLGKGESSALLVAVYQKHIAPSFSPCNRNINGKGGLADASFCVSNREYHPFRSFIVKISFVIIYDC